ncbi:NIPSNAP family protein [Amycolatopsis minnesotensis]|uniref:NIPSNAP family protein n=1 Tax=Amycolatopsis minnesotensis TaxID=337894 RepID=A0ABN2S214_9PSEU
MADAVLELRQYTLHPGRRDDLIELFDREFVGAQEECDMRIPGRFRDRRNPDRFVWLRAFSGMAAREEALTAFYGGPVWQAHRDAANATMVDSDNVLLLRPVRALDEIPSSAGFVRVTICPVPRDGEERVVRLFEDVVAMAMTDVGAPPLAWYLTEPAENTFPALPVRTGERVFAWFTAFADADAHDRFAAAWDGDRELGEEPEVLELVPTWVRSGA